MVRLLPLAERLAHAGMNARGLRSRTAFAGGARVHVYDGRGAGKLPPVVLIHGLGAAGPSFARLVALVQPHVRRVVVPELPGHGRSAELTGSRLTPEVLLATMASALDEVLDEPAVVYGNSLGGAVALHYATQRPEKVRALVLVSPAGARLPEEEYAALQSAFAIHSRRDATRFFDRTYHRPPWFLALIAHEFLEVVKRRAVQDLLETSTPDDAFEEEALATLRMPVLLLWGRSDRLLPAAALTYFKQHLPSHAVIEEPEGFGHSPQLEQPERLAARMLAFVREATAAQG